MFSPKYKIFIVIIIIMMLTTCKGQINMTLYKQMPELYVFDDFKECFSKETLDLPTAYCMIYAEIQPDNTSLLWQQIDKFSNSYKFHYRHDHLFRGVCLAKIKNFKTNTTDYNSDIPESEITSHLKRVFNNSIDKSIDTEYQQKIRHSVNEAFNKEYNLTLQTLVLYCESSKQPQKSPDFGFKFTISVCVFIIVLNISSSLYDAYLKSQLKEQDHNYDYYKKNHKTKVFRYLTTFSLCRNFNRLVAPSKNEDLRFLDGIRTILAFYIVFEHMFSLQFSHLKNPEFFENFYHEFIALCLYHGVFVELFFVLSGLMLYIKFENGQYITSKSSIQNCIQVYGQLIFSRYFRFLPSLAFLILISVNFVKYFQNGPFGRYLTQPFVVTCREYWWTNILMINNFSINSSCWIHTWYIAADFQLYAFFLLILIIVAKYPKYKIFLIAIIALISAALLVFINYLLKLEAFPSMSLEGYRYMFAKDVETGEQLYMPSYTNLNGFLIGIICGELYIKYLKNNTKNKEFFGKILKYSPYIGWSCIMAIFCMGPFLLFEKPAIWTALYGLLERHLTIDIMTATIISFLICRGGIMQKFLSSLPFRLMARISYQVYLWHFVIYFLIINYFTQVINITVLLMLGILLTAYITASIFGFFVALMVEYPIAEIYNIFNFKCLIC